MRKQVNSGRNTETIGMPGPLMISEDNTTEGRVAVYNTIEGLVKISRAAVCNSMGEVHEDEETEFLLQHITTP